MKKRAWIFSSLFCFSALQSANYEVTAATEAELRTGISTILPSGGTLTFDPSLTGSSIVLTSPLIPLANAGGPLVINTATGPFITIDGGGYPIFYAGDGVAVSISNFDLVNAASIGGQGASASLVPAVCVSCQGPKTPTYSGGGGGGGLGAGGALFVDKGASATLINVSCYGNVAQGGAGGTGMASFSTSTSGNLFVGGGGGGGGAFYGALAAGGPGEVFATALILGSVDVAAGGGGGGGGSGAGLPGVSWQGGTGGGPSGGSGGATGKAGGAAGSLFSGGGGGGGFPSSGFVLGLAGGSGGSGSDFGGGGGGGGLIGESSLVGSKTVFGGAGGNFGGGGGGGGPIVFTDNSVTVGLSAVDRGGSGGFGAGGGGADGFSLFGGGRGGATVGPSPGVLDTGGGGGAGMGGAIFVREGGELTIHYSLAGLTGLTGNSSVGGTAGGGLVSQAGSAYGPDLFLNAGGALRFFLDVPLTIASDLDSDPDVFAPGLPLQMVGPGPLTLLGDNTFSGGVSVSLGTLIVESASNLGLTAPGGGTLTLDSGTLQVQGSTFSAGNPVRLGLAGGTLSAPSGVTALFSGSIADRDVGESAPLFIGGSGAVQLQGNNFYTQKTEVGPSSTLQILAREALPVIPTVLNGGALDFLLVTGTIASSISGTGTLRALPPSFADLAGINTSAGEIVIESGATLGIASSLSLSEAMSIVDDGSLYLHHPSGVVSATAISGVGDVWQTGNGTLVLSIDNTYSGGTIIRKGVVQISGGSALGEGPVTINGGSLQLLNPFTSPLGVTAIVGGSGGNLIVEPPSVATASGNWSLGGTLGIRGGGSLSLTGAWSGGGSIVLGDNTTLILSTANVLPQTQNISGSGSVSVFAPDETFLGVKSYEGNTVIAPGVTLTIGVPSGFPSSTNVTNSGQLVFDFGLPSFSKTLDGNIAGTGTLTVQEGILTLEGMNTYGGTTDIFSDGRLQIAATAAIPLLGAVHVDGALVFQNTTGAALPGLISGSGTVHMDGTGGSLSLTAANSYQGGTFFGSGFVQIESPTALGSGGYFFHGGSLELLPAFVGPLTKAATVSLPGGAIQLDGVNTEYSGQMVGSGSFGYTGSGRIVLSALNQYTGDTLIGPSATLQLLQSSNLSSQTLIQDAGELLFSIGTGTVQVPNTIEGSGRVTLTGGANFSLLSALNSYQGGTLLSSGTLQILDISQIGTGPITLLGGGTLKFAPGNYSTSQAIALGVQGGKIEMQSGASLALAGSISSSVSAPLTIRGDGVLAFSGSNTSSGLTTIEGNLTSSSASFTGPVTVAAGGTLKGSGSLGALSNAGTIEMQAGETFSVTGDYSQTSPGTLKVQITGSGSHSAINSSEQLVLDGSLTVEAKSGVYIQGTVYPILTSQFPFFTQFSDISLSSNVPLTLIYSQDPTVFLVVDEQAVLSDKDASGHNPSEVLKNLREIEHTSSIGLVEGIEAMADLSQAQFSNALDQLHPAIFGAFDLLNVNASSQLTSIFSRHGAETCCFNLNDSCSLTDASLWAQPFGSFYEQDQIGEQIGFDAQTLGIAVGINFSKTSGLLLGIGAAYSSSKLDWDRSRGDGSMDKATLALYADYASSSFMCAASLLGSLDMFTASRHIKYSTVNEKARHQDSGYDLTAHIGGSGDFALGAFSLSPFANLDYLYLFQKPYTESGAGSLNLKVQGRRSNMLRSELGLDFTRSYPMAHGGCFSPHIFLSGINECFLTKRHVTASFINQSPTFKVRPSSHPIYLVSPGIELDFLWKTGLSLAIRYSGEFNSDVARQRLDTRFEWFF